MFKAASEVSESDEERSTLSEISEQIIADEESAAEKEVEDEKEQVELENQTTEEEQDEDDEANSEKERAELSAKLAELVKQKEDSDESLSSDSTHLAYRQPLPTRIEEETVSDLMSSGGDKKSANRPPKNEEIAKKIENLLLSQAIDQIIEVRDRKLVKNLSEASSDGRKPAEYIETPNNVVIPQIPPIDLSAAAESEEATTAATQAKKPASFNIPYSREKVASLCDLAVEDYYWKNSNNLKSLLDSNFLDDETSSIQANQNLVAYFKSSLDVAGLSDDEERTQKLQIELNFKRMLLDLVGELFYDLYQERYEQEEVVNEFVPCLRRKLERKYFKSMARGPSDLARAKQLVRSRVLSFVKLSNEEEDELVAEKGLRSRRGVAMSKSKWKILKKLDLVDGLLDKEMREQEFEWSNYDVEEYEAKLLVSNTVFDILLKDTIESMKDALTRKVNLIN